MDSKEKQDKIEEKEGEKWDSIWITQTQQREQEYRVTSSARGQFQRCTKADQQLENDEGRIGEDIRQPEGNQD